MKLRPWCALVVVCLLFAQPLFAQNLKLPLPVPDGTKVSPIKFGDSETPVELKPQEQVALLFVSAIWSLEERALENDSVKRLVPLGELIKGIKTPVGEVIGLTVTPVKDTNYTYDLMIIGQDILIRAIPRVKGLGGFARIGPVKGFGGVNFWYNPDGADMTKAMKITEMGFSGNGFSR